MSRHIEPCPYCGHEMPGHEVRYVSDRMAGGRITCHECGAAGPWAEGLDAAVDAWGAMPREGESHGRD